MADSYTDSLAAGFILSALIKLLVMIFAFWRLLPLWREARRVSEEPVRFILGGFILLAVGFGLSDVFDFLLAATDPLHSPVGAALLWLIFTTSTAAMLAGVLRVHHSVQVREEDG